MDRDDSGIAVDASDTGSMSGDSSLPPPIDGGRVTGPCGEETCGDGLDDDCDGVVDNDCFCVPGDEAACFRGPAETRGVGVCVDGAMICEDALEFGMWSDCEGDVLPGEEVCDGLLDENCDGAVDEGCDCTPGAEPTTCGLDVGACALGTQACNDGMLGECEGAIGPVAETCNGIDDNCDGVIDEGLTRACGSSVGECAMGTETCIDGAWDTCSGGRDSAPEACNGLDDDCDGSVDEELVRDCGSAVGACVAGSQTCSSAAWSVCTGETSPILEDCNGVDDDCDGATDEELSRRCGTDLGACTAGTESCVSGSWGTCAGEVAPGAEACDGLLDENCDGTVDEGCGCVTGRTRSCGTDVGACRAGTETCDATGAWGTCTGETGPGSETCNGIDDDCDGTTDEGLTRGCGTDVGACRTGTETCSSGAWGSCAGSVGPGAEVCDGTVDEDCDGLADEGCGCTAGTTRSCGSSVGACSSGTETCDLSGTWGACSGAVGPGTESCNGIDDNCDGSVDEGLSRGCGSDIGACVAGAQTCAAGSWGTCAGSVGPSAEICDGSNDDDCDGTVDEGCSCVDGATRSCGTSTGACVLGSQTCASGGWAACLGGTDPTGETCNGLDDDCDGAIDDGLVRSCGSDVGVCTTGTETCSVGSWGACGGSVGPSAELCDGALDQDCDGVVDDGCDCVTGATRGCGTNRGACVAGTETCDGSGRWGSCVGDVGPSAETCNGVDDDCDGSTDELLSRSCGTDLGACTFGTETCSSGSWGTCGGGVTSSTERCDGSTDEDCDGLVDEGCACINGDTRSCGTSVGACVFGIETCNLSGAWGSCIGDVGPSAETCNGIDDDCDGAVDDGTCIFVPPVVMCAAGMSAEVLSTVTLSSSGSDPDGGPVSYSWTVISRPVGSTATPSAPTNATTNFFLDASGSYELEFCTTDDEGDRACCRVTVISTPPGVLHVEVSWDEPYGDVDAHLLNVTRVPDDGWFTTDDCFYANSSPDWGPAGAAANPAFDRDDRDGFGPENITIDSSPASGTYTIGVHYYCDNSAGGSGATDATVRVYCMGSLIATYTRITLSDTDDWNTVAEVTYPSCVGRSINDRTNGTSILPASITSPRHCEVNCNTNADCPAGERCVSVVGGGAPRKACILL